MRYRQTNHPDWRLRLLLFVALPLIYLVLASPTPWPRTEQPADGFSAVVEAQPTAVSAPPTPLVVPPTAAPLVDAALPLPLAAAPLSGQPLAPPGQITLVPIVMYHYVRYVDAAADPLGFSLSVTPEGLAAQLDWLRSSGYGTVLMRDVQRCYAGSGPCPARAVALTFDDGYADAYSTALPLLRERGMVATFYIVSGFVGQPGYVNWDEVRALRDAGMEIGAHSITHPDLTTLDDAEATNQIAGSRQTISTEIGQEVASFCYPAGRFDERIAAITRAAGYTNATTTVPGAAIGDPFALSRIRVSGETTRDGYAATITTYVP
jgi:peptidoglycan/xylan/chitin deacetylase (PgdA/CDA1 family)